MITMIHPIFFAPKMYKDMAEKRMNEFQQVVDAEYVYAEAADGSQVRIKKSDFMELLRAELGYSFLKNNPNEAIEDCNIYAGFSKNGFILWTKALRIGHRNLIIELYSWYLVETDIIIKSTSK